MKDVRNRTAIIVAGQASPTLPISQTKIELNKKNGIRKEPQAKSVGIEGGTSGFRCGIRSAEDVQRPKNQENRRNGREWTKFQTTTKATSILIGRSDGERSIGHEGIQSRCVSGDH
jgi:hypothetical protein